MPHFSSRSWRRGIGYTAAMPIELRTTSQLSRRRTMRCAGKRTYRAIIRIFVCCIGSAILCGCVTPAGEYARAAKTAGFESATVNGNGFTHAFFRSRTKSADNSRLHVYIEGDGKPWIGNVAAADPTPRKPVALQWMSRDPNPAVLIGRPCYHGLRNNALCTPKLWTDARYATIVVESLALAITRLQREHPYDSIVLIGYSGGGTLAQLVAARIPSVAAIVTVGANLDTERWTEQRHYLPLIDSMNPIDGPALAATVTQIHYIGSDDSVVPPDSRLRFFRNHSGAEDRVIDGFDHQCCWTELWQEILSDIDRRLQ